MKIENKKLNNGFSLPELGLGTWEMGGGREVDNSKDKETIEVIQKAISMGYVHIDTAESYGLGHCEELVGLAIKDFSRKDLIIATKVASPNLAYDNLLKSAYNSLKRLGVDYIDLYYIHAPNISIPLEETMKAMDRLVNDKIVKNIAVSNFTLDLLKEAQKYSSNKIVANQIEYSLLTRNKGRYGGRSNDNEDIEYNINMESETLPYCQNNDILVVAERPLERGILLEPTELMTTLSKKYNKTYAQIAINWLISQDNVVTIPKSSNLKHLEENLGAVGWNLENEDIELLRKEYLT